MAERDELQGLLDEDSAERNALSRRLLAVLASTEEHVRALRAVAHDLRNPLAVLGTETLRLREWLDMDDPRQRELVEDHEAAVTQCDELVDQLLRLGRESSAASRLQSEPVDVRRFGRRLERRLQALAAGRQLEASVLTTLDAPDSVEVDPLVLDRIVDNLITNAVTNASGGAVHVEVGGEHTRWLVVELRDEAGGLPPEVLDRLASGDLEALERPDGRGIGLSVVVALLRRVGGHLDVWSRRGQGTTFRVRIPVRPRQSLATSGVRPSSRVVTVHDDAPRAAAAAGERLG